MNGKKYAADPSDNALQRIRRWRKGLAEEAEHAARQSREADEEVLLFRGMAEGELARFYPLRTLEISASEAASAAEEAVEKARWVADAEELSPDDALEEADAWIEKADEQGETAAEREAWIAEYFRSHLARNRIRLADAEAVEAVEAAEAAEAAEKATEKAVEGPAEKAIAEEEAELSRNRSWSPRDSWTAEQRAREKHYDFWGRPGDWEARSGGGARPVAGGIHEGGSRKKKRKKTRKKKKTRKNV